MKILYISYDGILEPLGESQVLNYLETLAKDFGHQLTLLSFEKSHDKKSPRFHEMKSRLQDIGIHWVPLTYHKSPRSLATLYDVALGCLYGSFLILSKKCEIIHARSYVASLMATFLKKFFKKKFIFDMRGFWADERLESGSWEKSSRMYKLIKSCEKLFLIQADAIVSLTHSAVTEIKKFSYYPDMKKENIFVIPTCTNIQAFASTVPLSSKTFTLGYLGTTKNWYNFGQTVVAFQLLKKRDPSAHYLIVTRDDHIELRQEFNRLNVESSEFHLSSATLKEIPAYTQQMNAGIFFIKPSFAKKASMPTKLGEFMAAGIPVLTGMGIGDVDEILSKNNVGVTIADFMNEASLQTGIDKLVELSRDPSTSARCKEVAKKYFSLHAGCETYDRIYKFLQ